MVPHRGLSADIRLYYKIALLSSAFKVVVDAHDETPGQRGGLVVR